jgi:hypothetical protein
MKPLSGRLLYINLVLAIIWDTIGFFLFILGLIPGAQPITITASLVIDATAFFTDLIFCILYQGYVKIYNANFKLYQLKRIREMMRLSKKNSGTSNNSITKNLARQTQKINQYMLDNFSNYIIGFTVKKIQYSIFTSVVEIIPWIGDFSPSWTIKANLHLREHRKMARELKIRNTKFEKSLAKWRGSLKIGGVRKFMSPKNKNTSVKETNSNNIRTFKRRVPSEVGQSPQPKKDMNLDVKKSAANNIRPFRSRLPVENAQPVQAQNNNKLANIQSTANNVASISRQLVGSIPQQSLKDEDDELQYRNQPINDIKSIKKQVFSDISKPVSAKKDNILPNIKSVNNEKLGSNNIRQFSRSAQSQVNSDKILETLIKK